MICQQCGTENSNAQRLCSKCGRPLRSQEVKGVVTCKNHGNRAATTICEQCLRPICEECTVVTEQRTLCIEDSRIDLSDDEDERIDHLAIADPSVTLHAGFSSRAVSLLIDFIVLLVLAVVLMSLFWLVTGIAPSGLNYGRSQPLQFVLYWIIYSALVFAYFVLLTASEGQTFGKQAMRIAVVQPNGTTPSLTIASVRFLYSFISLICLGAGFFAIIKDPEKRAWHDRWVNTYVISLDEAVERL